MSNKKNNNTYDASSIEVLEGLEAVRRRPEMYIGSRGPRGLHHLVWEVVDNSVDEYLAKYCSMINVTINKNGSVTVEDNGRGIPVEIHEKMQKPTVEVVLTQLHAGGKFGGGGYQVSGGLHGVGVKAVNALSTKLEVEIKRDSKIHTMSFGKGKVTKTLKSKRGKKSETGTKITFYPDPQIFAETIEFDRNTITDRLEETSYLNPKLTINFKDLRGEKPYEKVFYSENGIIDLLEIKTKKLNSLSKQNFELSGEKDLDRKNPDTGVEETVKGYANIVFKYTNTDNENFYNFVNNIRTKDGEHVKGFRQAVHKAFNQSARDLKVLKDKEPDLRDKDTLSGIVSIIYVKIPDPRFEGQTKETLESKEGYDLVYNLVYDEAIKYFKKNKPLVKKLTDYAREQAKMREELKATKELTQDNSLLASEALPGKLADCSSEDIKENELFIVEGNSAGGSAKQGRDRNYQAILALRGKILNVQGKRVQSALNSMEIQSITASLGCGVKDLCDPSKLRYGKVILLTDADVDGAHIQSLLLTFFFHYMKPLIDEGRLFIAKPPLYKITFTANAKSKYKKGDAEYLYDDKDLDSFLKKYPTSIIEIQRYKGLGEMNAEQLWDTTMDPKTRKLDQVLIQDAVLAEEHFNTFMGNNNDEKVDFIRKVIKAYKLKKQDVKNIGDLEELAELDLNNDEVRLEIEKRLSQYNNVVEKNVELKTITGVLKDSIGDYAYYVNIKRSIPDIRDGLKPVQRRIVWAMWQQKMTQDKPYKKSARVVGEVIGKYHPHGDSAVYDALVKLAQPFHENLPIMDFHGNHGSVDGDQAAAMRYTETRLSPYAEDMVEYINYNTVEFEDNFSYEYKEPVYLPGKFPFVLINGTSGLGVSVSTDIPAHNVNEVFKAIEYVVDNPSATVKQIMKYIKGPDFPTGGILIDDDLYSAYNTGNGSYKIRAKIHTEVIKGKQALVITEIPYNVTTEQIVKKVRDSIKEKKEGKKITPKKIPDIIDYKDESDKKDGIRLIFFLKKTANAEEVKKQLYQYTPLEKSYKINLLAVEHDEIKMFTLRDMIDSYIDHRQKVLTKKFEYELDRKEQRKHLLDGYLKILRPLSNLDKAISIIRGSKDTTTARNKLMKEFDLTEVQAQYILDRRLSTLSRADFNALKEEVKQLKEDIAYINKILGDINEVNKIIKEELREMATKYAKKRNTVIVKKDKIDAIDQATEEVTDAEEIYVGLDTNMKLKKVKATDKKTVINSESKSTPMIYIEKTDSSQKLLGLTRKNYIVQSNLEVLPYSTDKNKRGMAYDVKQELKSTGTIDKLKLNYQAKEFVLLLFADGEIEKMPVTYFQSSEYIYEKKIVDFIFANEDDNIIITTKLGKLIAIEVSQFREGKKLLAINLDKDDSILHLDYYNEKGFLLVITENNYANLVPMNEFTPQTRGGKGIFYFKQGAKTGFPVMSYVLDSDTQSVYLESNKSKKLVKAKDITSVATRTVIGKLLSYEVKSIIPIFK